MTLFMYNYTSRLDMLDRRDINTRRRDGILFIIDDFENYRSRQDPMYRAMNS